MFYRSVSPVAIVRRVRNEGEGGSREWRRRKYEPSAARASAAVPWEVASGIAFPDRGETEAGVAAPERFLCAERRLGERSPDLDSLVSASDTWLPVRVDGPGSLSEGGVGGSSLSLSSLYTPFIGAPRTIPISSAKDGLEAGDVEAEVGSTWGRRRQRGNEKK